jgi:hypothetical protein
VILYKEIPDGLCMDVVLFTILEQGTYFDDLWEQNVKENAGM